MDEQSESVYVMGSTSKNGGPLVEKFDLEGNPSNFSALGTNVFETTCGTSCRQLAVDNSGGPNQGTIYISAQQTNANALLRVYAANGNAIGTFANRGFPGTTSFCGVATDPSGAVYVTHAAGGKNAALDKYEPAEWALYPNQEPLIAATLQPLDAAQPCKISADSTGRLYIIRGNGTTSTSELHLFEPGANASTVADESSNFTSVDYSNDEVYSDHHTSIGRLNSTGDLTEEFGSAELTDSYGVAVNGQTGTVYASNWGATAATSSVKIYTTLPTPDVTTGTVTAGHESAVLTGHVEPGPGGNVTECAFEVAPADGPYSGSIPCEPAVPYAADQDVTAEATGLQAGGIRYKFRLTATDANGKAYTRSGSFSTTKPPSVDGLYTTDLTETTADLHAVLNPNGAETSYRFEYGPSAEYGSAAPIPDGTVAAGFTGQKVMFTSPT